MRWILMTFSILVLSASLAAEEAAMDKDACWPQWRGPLATGVAPMGDPPLEWSETKNIRWKVPIPGMGHSTPVAWGDRIYVLSAVETEKEGPKTEGDDEKPDRGERRGRRGRMRNIRSTKIHEFVLLAVDRSTGKILWKRIACEAVPHEGMHPDGSMASNSPVTDGERIFAFFGSRGLFCYDMKGVVLWNKDFGDMSIHGRFGEGASPVLFGDAIVVVWDHEGESFIACLDKKTGKERWRKPRDEGTSWSTPLALEHDGKIQVITSATTHVQSYDLATGKILWKTTGMTRNVVPCPVFDGERVYVMSGFRGAALLAVDLAEITRDEKSEKAFAWTYDQMTTPYVPSPLLFEGNLYFLRSNEEKLTVLDAVTGKSHYALQRLEGLRGIYSSPVGAKGRVYIVGRNGVTAVLREGPRFEVLATNSLEDRFSASPIILGKELILRGHENLYSIAEK